MLFARHGRNGGASAMDKNQKSHLEQTQKQETWYCVPSNRFWGLCHHLHFNSILN